MLIRNNIITLKDIIINIVEKIAYIYSYNTIITIKA